MSCFVCEIDDGRILYKVCNCSTFAHRDCMEDVIRRVRAHNTQCPVCCTKYDVASHHVQDIRLFGSYARETIISYATTLLLTIATIVVYMCDETTCNLGVGVANCPIVIVLGGFSVGFLCLSIMFHMSNARLCCVGSVQRLVHVSLNVPIVQQL